MFDRALALAIVGQIDERLKLSRAGPRKSERGETHGHARG